MKTILALLAIAWSAAAQWSNVTALPGGQTVVVAKKAGTSVSGKLVRATEDSVVVQAKAQEVSIPKADVARVQVKGRRHAKWWGLAIGAGSGAGVGASIGSRANGNFGDVNVGAWVAGIFAVAGALIGLGVGVSLDLRHSTIYRG